MAHIPNQEEVKVIEQSKVSPPPGSVSTASLPLTFFDVPWLLCCQIQRLYFYEFAHPTHHFLQTLLPTLKHSLCLTLRHFFPFAANLVFPPPPEKPHILFTDGDFVSLTVAESSVDFDFLSANHPRPVRALHPFVPKLASTRVKGETLVLGPLLALQVTVFPNSGICIGVRFNHVAADGRAFHHFMKSWALVGRSGGDLTRLERELGLPSHDRTAVKDPNGLDWVLLYTWRSLESTNSSDQDRVPTDQSNGVVVNEDDDNVRATFVLRQAQIERLKRWAKNHFANDNDNNSTPFHISLFVVTCALVWVCLAKSEETTERNPTAMNKLDIDDEPYYFIVPADCRSRVQFQLPTTYFGNCLTALLAPATKKELLGERGMVAAAKAIGKEVTRLLEISSEALTEMTEKSVMMFKEVTERWQHVCVAGSPKLGVYETDFGWGRPKKSESVHVKDSTSFSLAESRDERGGIEVSLALNKDRMSRFSTILEESLLKFV